MADTKLQFTGTGYEYANGGYAVALLIVQTVTGMPYDQYLTTRYSSRCAWRGPHLTYRRRVNRVLRTI